MQETKAVAFDLGGTLIDDRNMVYSIFGKVFEQLDMSVPDRERFDENFTSNWVELFSERKDVEPQKLTGMFQKYSLDKNYLRQIKPYAGTVDALERIKKKMRVALNTSYRKNEVEAILGIVKLPKFDFIATGDNIAKLKPDPRPINEICSALGMHANECIMVGDTSADILCGKNAGSKTIAVTWGTNNERDLSRLKPDLIAYSWNDILDFLGIN